MAPIPDWRLEDHKAAVTLVNVIRPLWVATGPDRLGTHNAGDSKDLSKRFAFFRSGRSRRSSRRSVPRTAAFAGSGDVDHFDRGFYQCRAGHIVAKQSSDDGELLVEVDGNRPMIGVDVAEEAAARGNGVIPNELPIVAGVDLG